MNSIDMYKSWRDTLLSEVSNNICKPCTDKQKEQFNINYDNPLYCDCHCDQVEDILENARIINEGIKILSMEKE